MTTSVSQRQFNVVDYLAELKRYADDRDLYDKPDGFEIVDSLGNRWQKFNGWIDDDEAFFLFCDDGTRHIRLSSGLSPWSMFKVEPSTS